MGTFEFFALLVLTCLIGAGAAGLVVYGYLRRRAVEVIEPPPPPASLLEQTRDLAREKLQLELDIETHKRIEEELRRSEEKYRALIENANDLIVIAQDGAIRYANPKAELVFGWRTEELAELPFTEIVAPDDRQLVVERYYRRQMGEPVPERYNFRAVTRDGRTLWVEINSVLMGWEGRPATLCFLRDVTEQIEAAADLRTAREAAETANRAKSRFLANMSHEIRTPMNAIIGLTELALSMPLAAEQRRYLSGVLESADFLLSLLNTILDLSKIEAGKLDVVPVEFSLREELGDTIKTLSLRAAEKGLELLCHVRPGVPNRLIGDSGRLRQIVLNLAGNAIKFTPAGEVLVSVEPVSTAGNEIVLRFAVRDTGIGIPAEKQQSIFEPFEQADDSTTRQFGGTGLGLAISSQLVEMMGGEIWVESQPGAGTVFAFTAKFQQAATGELEPSLPANLQGSRVLVIEDHRATREALCELLAAWGMQATAAADASEALANVGLPTQRTDARPPGPADEPAYLIVDDTLPDSDGVTLAGELHARLPHAGIVLLMRPGDPEREMLLRETQPGVTLVAKPVMPSDLLEALVVARGGPHGGTHEAAGAPHEFGRAATPLRILLTEDNPINRRVAVHLLTSRGHRVSCAGDGQEALQRLRDEHFDLVLMDLQMPVMGGEETTAQIRAAEQGTGRHLPVVAMTAHALKGDRERCLAAGMDDYIAKPIRARQLFEVVERYAPTCAVANAAAGRDEATSNHRDGVTAGTASASGSQTTPARGEHTPSTSTPPDPSPNGENSATFDVTAALTAVGGDRGLLREIVALFRADAPGWLAELADSIAAGDAPRLRRIAHTLKNSAGYFGAGPTYRLALELEERGRNSDLAGADAIRARLAAEIGRLDPALEQFERAG
ncbi:MAG: response regulator [Pirellulales bacterium]|nr:response regulator [Pirellulales bacterium]